MGEKKVKAVCLQDFQMGGVQYNKGQVALFIEEQVQMHQGSLIDTDISVNEKGEIDRLNKQITELKKKIAELEKDKQVKGKKVK